MAMACTACILKNGRCAPKWPCRTCLHVPVGMNLLAFGFFHGWCDSRSGIWYHYIRWTGDSRSEWPWEGQLMSSKLCFLLSSFMIIIQYHRIVIPTLVWRSENEHSKIKPNSPILTTHLCMRRSAICRIKPSRIGKCHPCSHMKNQIRSFPFSRCAWHSGDLSTLVKIFSPQIKFQRMVF